MTQTWNDKARHTPDPWKKKSKTAKKAHLNALGGLYAESPLDAEQSASNLTPETPIKKKGRGRPAKGESVPKRKREPAKIKIGLDGEVVLTERDEQRLVVVYCQNRKIPFYAIPNGARRTFWEAREAKLSGMQSGVSDLCFPQARKGYHGMYIEMKRREGGILSDTQKYWLELFNREGYYAVVAYGSREAFKIIEAYFDLGSTVC